MTPEQFCYWLQGFAELHGCIHPTPTQWRVIQEHLALVFDKVTTPQKPLPPRSDYIIPSDKRLC